MKTAVEWLEEQMLTWGDQPRWMRDNIVDQAKEMEKEQIVNSRQSGIDAALKGYAIGNEQYYNETYKTNRNEKRID